MKKIIFIAVIGLLSLSAFASKVIEKQYTYTCKLTLYYSDGSILIHTFPVNSVAECKSYADHYNN